MGSTHRAGAVERMRSHLNQFDWSAQSASRRLALEAFLRLANVHGFAAVTMRMLAKELNIKAPSLYAHFPDGKDEIVGDSLRWHFTKFGEAILEAVQEAATPEAFWNAMVEVHVRRQVELPESNLWDLLVATDASVHFLPADLRRDVDALVALYEDMYRAAAEDMGHEVSSDVLALVMTILEGATRWCVTGPIDAGVARAVQVSHAFLRLPAVSEEALHR
jgi:AcrR family transcriptional regulator